MSDIHSAHNETVPGAAVFEVFVSRLHPLTTNAEIIECVYDALGGNFTNDITCNKLSVKHEHLYASFHVSALVDSVHMKTHISQLMSPNDSLLANLFADSFLRKMAN